jgi:hypothetical protein
MSDAESLKRHMEWLYPDPKKPCLCESAWVSMGRFNGINMGHGWARTTTHPKCPHHALCQSYTAKVRAKEWNGQWLYCNVHRRKDCPVQRDGCQEGRTDD